MTNPNITERGIQTTGLGLMIGRFSLDSRYEGHETHPANVGCLGGGGNTNDEIRNTNAENGRRKTTDLQFTECTRFMTTSQRLANQAWVIIKKGWFSGLEISEIHQQIDTESCQQNPNMIFATINAEKQELSNEFEAESNINQNTTHSKHHRTITNTKKNE